MLQIEILIDLWRCYNYATDISYIFCMRIVTQTKNSLQQIQDFVHENLRGL